MSASHDNPAVPAAFRKRTANVSRPHARHLVLGLTIACIVALGVLTAGGVDSHIARATLGSVMAVSFIALALLDFRMSVAVTIFELVLGGAGGHWIDFGGISGRIFLISVVTLVAAWLTIADWRRGLHPILGRYGTHALALAVVIPAIWIPLGLIDGNGVHNVVADGNGFLFFAFILVVLTLVRRGDGGWLRRVFFAACATNAAAYLLLIIVTSAGMVSLETVTQWLTVRLSMGGVIGYMPNGDYRLFTAGSLFVVVGLVLTAQRLLVRPRDPWLWLLGAVLTTDLIATYTRGLWLSAAISVVLVLALEAGSARQLGLAILIPGTVLAVAIAMAPLANFSLYGYIFDRAKSITASGQALPHRVENPSFEGSTLTWGVNAAGGLPALHALRTTSVAHSGTHSLELSNSKADQDAYAFQNLSVKPNRTYAVSAWLNARGLREPAAAERGLLIWDAQDGRLYTVPLTRTTKGWKHLTFTFPTRSHAGDVQIRLYAPEGRVLWDDVQLNVRGHAGASAQATGGGVQASRLPTSSATQTMDLASTGGGNAAGAASNEFKAAEARALWAYIKERPIFGYGFGKIATAFATRYTYELSYLDLLLKAGFVGLLLYLSFPLRLVVDALRMRRSTALKRTSQTGARGVVVGVVSGILLAGATNPYLFAAFGLVSIVLMVAWLEEPTQS